MAVTLTEAFRLCNVGREIVYLRHAKESSRNDGHRLRASKIREKFDMQKIRVMKIELEFEHFGSDVLGWRFVVTGISPEELCKAEC